MQGTRNPPSWTSKEKDFSRNSRKDFSVGAFLPLYLPGDPIQGTEMGSVHCCLSSDLESFTKEGFLPSKGQQAGCQLRANQVGMTRQLQTLPVLPVSPPWRNWFANTCATGARWKSCADERRGSNPNCSALCFATFTHIHFPPAGC